MKTPNCLLATLIVICGTLNSAAAEESTQTFQFSKNEQVTFVQRELVPAKDTEISKSGYAEFEGKLYFCRSTPPFAILKSATLMINGKKIDLDVSGLGDAWLVGDKLPQKYAQLKKDAESGVMELSVFFSRGGAMDYSVVWVIVGDKSIRKAIIDGTDDVPEWVKEKHKSK